MTAAQWLNRQMALLEIDSATEDRRTEGTLT